MAVSETDSLSFYAELRLSCVSVLLCLRRTAEALRCLDSQLHSAVVHKESVLSIVSARACIENSKYSSKYCLKYNVKDSVKQHARRYIKRQVFGAEMMSDVQESRLETTKTAKIFLACGGLSLRRAETVFTVGNFLVQIFVAPP